MSAACDLSEVFSEQGSRPVRLAAIGFAAARHDYRLQQTARRLQAGPVTQTRSVEWLLACMMLAWGMGLLMPGNTMSLPQYRMLSEMAPEPVWAVWSLSIGATRVAALYINGSWKRTPLIRAVCAGLGMCWWLVLGALFFMSRDGGPMPAGFFWFPVLIAFEGYSVHRGARDSYHSGALQRWAAPG